MRVRITRKRILWGALVLTGMVLVALRMRPAPVDVESARAGTGPMEVTVEEDGRVRVRDRFVVTAPVSGRLERMVLREGTRIAAGVAVARIQPLPLDERARTQMEAALRAAEARQRATTTVTAQAAAARDQARRELERRRALAAQGAIADEQVEQYALVLRGREQELTAAQEAARAAAAETEAARAALLGGGAGSERSAVIVRAPAAGVVLRVPERSGRIVAAGATLLELGEASLLEVVVDVLSTDAARIRPGMVARLTGWGGPELEAKVRLVEPSAFTSLSALGVEEQRVNVVLDIADCPPEMGDGYRVEVAILVWSGGDVLNVPAAVLFRQNEGWALFTVESGRARMRAVQIGERGAARVQILGGIEAGAEVVLFPSDRLVDGARVRVLRRAAARSAS